MSVMDGRYARDAYVSELLTDHANRVSELTTENVLLRETLARVIDMVEDHADCAPACSLWPEVRDIRDGGGSDV